MHLSIFIIHIYINNLKSNLFDLFRFQSKLSFYDIFYLNYTCSDLDV